MARVDTPSLMYLICQRKVQCFLHPKQVVFSIYFLIIYLYIFVLACNYIKRLQIYKQASVRAGSRPINMYFLWSLNTAETVLVHLALYISILF